MNNAETRAKLMDAEAILIYLSNAEELLRQDSPEVLLATLGEKTRALVADVSETLEKASEGN